jgi:hypothetical protein
MTSERTGKAAPKRLSARQVAEARRLVEGGMTIMAVARKLGIARTTLESRARFECWGGVRRRGQPRIIEPEQIKAIEAKIAREEVLLAIEPTLVNAGELEVLACKALVKDSARVKVMISQRVSEILARLQDPEVSVRAAAASLGSLVPVLKLIYRMDEEPDLEQLRYADSPLADAIDPDFLGKSPRELQLEAEVKRLRDGALAREAREGKSAGGVDERGVCGARGGAASGREEAELVRTVGAKVVEVEAGQAPAVEARPSMEEARLEHRREVVRRAEYR